MKRTPAFSLLRLTCPLLFLAILACQDQPVEVPEPLFHEGVDEGGSHFRYGTLSWAPTETPGEVVFRLVAAFRRDAYGFLGRCIGVCPGGLPVAGDIIVEAQGPTQFNFGDGSAVTATLRFLVSAHSATENWVIGEALDPTTGAVGIRHTYGGPGPFTAYLAGFASVPPLNNVACCRIGQAGFGTTPGLNNRAGGPYPLQTVVFPQGNNRSPVSTMVPVVVVPPSAAATFLVPARDPDADPITWRLSTDAEAGGGSHPPDLSVNPSTGLVTWNTQSLDQTKFWTTQIVVEDQQTKTPVDFLLKIQPQVGQLPACSIDPAGPHTATVDSPFSLTVTATDAEGTVTLNSGALPAGATMSPALPLTGASPVSSMLSWTPTSAQVGSHVLIFSATDADNQQALCSTSIDVVDVVEGTLIEAGEGGTVTVEENGQPVAGVDIPAGTFDEDVIVRTEFVDVAEGECHEFLIAQVGRCLSVEIETLTGGSPVFNNPVIIAMCLTEDLPDDRTDPLFLYRFHTPTDNVVPLQNVAAPFLDCTDFVAFGPGRSAFRNLATRLWHGVTGWFSPRALVAAVAVSDLGFGGLDEGPGSFYVWARPIDIKPGSDPNSINCRNQNEVISVAIITTDEFDATTVDHTTVEFGPTAGREGDEARETHVDKRTGKARRHQEDLNGDGRMDLVFHFRFGDTRLECDDTFAKLGGFTFGGQQIESADFVRMIEQP